MMIPRLSTEDTALFICDIQGCFLKTIYGIEELLDTASCLLQGARILNIPCVITEQYPERLQHTVDSLQPYIQETSSQTAYPVFSKVDFTMCTEQVCDYMDQHLTNVKNIIVCGMETHVCVYQTCMDLLEKGFNVFICVDAVSSRSQVDRKVALSQLQASGIVLTTSETVLFQLIKSKNHPQFKAISALVKNKRLPLTLDL